MCFLFYLYKNQINTDILSGFKGVIGSFNYKLNLKLIIEGVLVTESEQEQV